MEKKKEGGKHNSKGDTEERNDNREEYGSEEDKKIYTKRR